MKGILSALFALASAALVSAKSSTSSPTTVCDISSITQFSYSIRGDVGKEGGAQNAELVTISWLPVSGNPVILRENYALSNRWETFHSNVPASSGPGRFIVTFLNDGTFQVRNNTVKRNVRFNFATFRINNIVIPSLGETISHPMLPHFLSKASHPGAWQEVFSGNFVTGGDYIFYFDLAEMCNKFESTNAVLPNSNVYSFNLRGNTGSSIFGENELVDIFYITAKGESVKTHSSVVLETTYKNFVVSIPKAVSIKKILIVFLNDKYWNLDGALRDRNVIMDASSLTLNGKFVKKPNNFIGGNHYLNFKKQKDEHRMTLVKTGVFAWQGYYSLCIDKISNQ
jgi:hypothetical protein